MKKDHDLPDDLLLGPGVRDPFGSNGADPRHLAKSMGFDLNDVEDFLPERLDHLLRINGPNAARHSMGAGGQYTLNWGCIGEWRLLALPS